MSDRIIELIKWFIGSVVLVVITLIIDTGFREREAEVREMQVYDKYVDIILSADNIEQRWKLSQYFSIVTPSDRLRQRWIAYKDTIQADYFLWRKSEYTDTSQVVVESRPLVSKGGLSAPDWETKGFTSLINRDINSAITNFQMAETSYPSYHNCFEISQYLIKNRNNITSDRDWKDLYSKILKDWSWGLNGRIKLRLKELSK